MQRLCKQFQLLRRGEAQNAVNGVLIRLLYRFEYPATLSKVPNTGSEPEANAVMDAVEVVDLAVAFEYFDDAVELSFHASF
jgi:hypothetical protein